MIEKRDLKEEFLAQMGYFLTELEKNKSLAVSGYKRGVRNVHKLAKCSRRKAHKAFSLMYAIRSACRVFLEEKPALNPDELFEVACEVLEEELEKINFSPEQIAAVRGVLGELLEMTLQEFEWPSFFPY